MRKCLSRVLIATLSGFLATTAAAQVAARTPSRALELMTELERSLARAVATPGFARMDAENQAQLLIKLGARVDAFNLQSLGRVYETYPLPPTQELMKSIRKQAKKLEDAMGAFDKYKTVGKRDRAKEAAQELLKLLAGEGWIDGRGRSPLLARMKGAVLAVRWLPEDQDQAFILTQLALQIEKVRTARHDMRRLEAGLHEIRRELRWFSISAKALGPRVAVSSRMTCPLRRLHFAAHADSKKYMLPEDQGTPGACVLSACVAQELVGAVGLFGELKDQAEPIFENDPRLHRDDLTPPTIAVVAQRAQATLMSSGALEHARLQLESCLRGR